MCNLATLVAKLRPYPYLLSLQQLVAILPILIIGLMVVVFIQPPFFEMNKCFVAYNYSKDNGGGIMFSMVDNGNGIIQNTLIANNTSQIAGAISAEGHILDITNSTIANNQSDEPGGIYSFGVY